MRSIIYRWFPPFVIPRLRDIEIKKWTATRDEFDRLGLTSSRDQVERMIKCFERKKFLVTFGEYCEMTQALIERLQDETSSRRFFVLPPHRESYFTRAATLFGEEVTKALSGSAQADIEHAAKCFAFGNNTAAVFHLMRVMEIGLRALGQSLEDPNLDPKRNPTWENILKRCDDELKLPVGKRSSEWSKDNQFYSDATANLRAVKNAWRNPTIHVEREYDEDEALSVINAVKGFMNHLATKLHI